MTEKRSRETRGPVDFPEFGPELTRLRESRGLNRKELAQRVAIDASHVTRLERGERGASRDLVERLARALDLSIREEHDLLRTAGFLTEQAAELLTEPELGRLATLLARNDLAPTHRTLLVRHLRLALDHAAALGYPVSEPLEDI
ncbi:MAG: helix-turn-helix transcriptional regulator [Thermomicrobiales bacterium]|nr:helix-turn-helix transcriptional regulator [Thermomicrobiales bacterium]